MPDKPTNAEQTSFLDAITWNDQGLLPAIAQEQQSGQILMMAWMNPQALQQTIDCGEAVYWSRSRQKLWHKGESSGHVQVVKEIRLDCDGDTLLLLVEQRGGIACHTGRHHCFFQKLSKTGSWENADPVLKDPKTIYEN